MTKRLTEPLERMLLHYKLKSFNRGQINKKGFETYQQVINRLKNKYDTTKYENEIKQIKYLCRYQLE